MDQTSTVLRTIINSLARAVLAAGISGPQQASASNLVSAHNDSKATLCAEEDNINIPLFAKTTSQPNSVVTSFTIEARHPGYEFDEDNSEPNYANCHPAESGFPFTPANVEIYNDIATGGSTIIRAVRESEWWQPNGMTATADSTLTDAKYIVVYKKVSPTHIPQVLVLYQDGNVRLKPTTATVADDPVFGSSVIIGPATPTERPLAAIDSVEYLPTSDSLLVTYSTGHSAVLAFEEITNEYTRIGVEANYPTQEGDAFTIFRSMYVSNDNADVERVEWQDSNAISHDDPILDANMTFPGGEGTEFLFKRETVSMHNTSAPDIWIGNFNAVRLGDMDADHDVDADDVPLFVQALVDPLGYKTAFPLLDATTIGDMNQNGTFDLGDIAGFKALFADPAYAVPEPSGPSLLVVFLFGIGILERRHV